MGTVTAALPISEPLTSEPLDIVVKSSTLVIAWEATIPHLHFVVMLQSFALLE